MLALLCSRLDGPERAAASLGPQHRRVCAWVGSYGPRHDRAVAFPNLQGVVYSHPSKPEGMADAAPGMSPSRWSAPRL